MISFVYIFYTSSIPHRFQRSVATAASSAITNSYERYSCSASAPAATSDERFSNLRQSWQRRPFRITGSHLQFQQIRSKED